MICEKCWANAYTRSYGTGKSQYECYLELLEERKDNPCPPERGLTPLAPDSSKAGDSSLPESVKVENVLPAESG